MMLKEFKGVTEFYGNGTVFVTDGDRSVQRLKEYNFQITAKRNDGDEYWNTHGVIVAIGPDCDLQDAAKEIRAVLSRLEKEVKL
jgi:hypothetical protein